MKAIFFIPQDETLYEAKNIVDLDLSCYDNLLVSRSVNPEFKVTFTFYYQKPESFENWWENAFTSDGLKIKIYDNQDTLLAQGIVFAWVENRESFELEITCTPNLLEDLEKSVEKVNFNNTISFPGSGNMRDLLCEQVAKVLYKMTKEALGQKIGCPDPYAFHSALQPVFQNVGTDDLAYSKYILYKTASLAGFTKKDILVQMALLLDWKLAYDIDTSSFIIDNHEHETIALKEGYIKSRKNLTEKMYSYKTIFSMLKLTDIKGKRLDQKDMIQKIKQRIEDRAKALSPNVAYEIWGYAEKTFSTGQILALDNEYYKVLEVAFEYETLDHIKSFTALCIKIQKT